MSKLEKKLYVFAAGFFMVTFCMTSVLSNIELRIFENFIFGLPLVMLLGSLPYTFGRVFLDIIQEFFGKEDRKLIIRSTIIIRIIIYLVIWLGISVGTYQQGVGNFFKNSLRMLVAGQIDMIITQYFLDPLVYSKIKKRMKGRSPFIRGTLSNMTSSIVHAVIFFNLAYSSAFNFLFPGSRNKSFKEIMGLIVSDPILDIPFLLITSAFGAGVIYVVKRYFKIKQVEESSLM